MVEEAGSTEFVKDFLLSSHDLSINKLMTAFGELSRNQIDYADLFFQYTRSESWSIEENIIKTGVFDIEQGLSVRANADEKTALAYSDEISLPALLSAAKSVSSIASHAASGIVQPAGNLVLQTQLLYSHQDPLASLTTDQKKQLLEKVNLLARKKDTRVDEVMATLAGSWEVILVLRLDGRLATDVRPLIRLSVTVFMSQLGCREHGTSGGGGRFGYEYFTDEQLENYIDQAIAQAAVNLEAKEAPAGTMEVVLGSGWPGILLHEAVGHGLEGDFNRKGSSAFSNQIGQKVAASGVTVLDDGTISDRRGSLSVDDEGEPTQKTVLIENGILKGYMQDALNARLMNMAPTGNGRRESYACLPMPRMTNTYMLSGSQKPEEIISSVKKGLYAANFGGGQVDITSGNFVFSASEAYLIENGKITTPVKGATLIGNGPEVMKKISLIGDDMTLDSGVGTCGKSGQSVPVGVGQPTLKIDAITVGGTG